MSKFCRFCGTNLPDEATACSSCGARLEQPQAQPFASAAQPQYATPAQPYPPFEAPPAPKKKKGKIIAIILIVLAVLLIGMVVLVVLSDSSVEDYQKPVEAWVEAIEKNDVEKMYGTYSEICYDVWEESSFSEEAAKDSLQLTIDFFIEEIKDKAGDDYELSVDYADSREYDNGELDDLLDEMKGAGFDEIEIEKAYDVKATIRIDGGDKEYESDEFTFVVVQVDGEWGIFTIRGLPLQAVLQ